MFIEGRIIDFLVLILLILLGIYMMLISKRWTPNLRILPGVQAIPELLGRSVELGRPVHVTTGYGGSLNRPEIGPQIMAGLSVYAHVVRLCAKLNAKLIVSVGQTDTIPILEAHLRQAYQAEGLPVPDIEETLRFHSRQQYAFMSAVAAIMRRERPAANIGVGPFWAESSMFANSAAQVGAMQLLGTARPSHIPWFTILSDYVLMGEEIYAAGAQLSGDQETINTLVAEDAGKYLAIILIVLGAVFMLFGSDLVIKILEV